jgi:hypothetical protein
MTASSQKLTFDPSRAISATGPKAEVPACIPPAPLCWANRGLQGLILGHTLTLGIPDYTRATAAAHRQAWQDLPCVPIGTPARMIGRVAKVAS